MNPLTRSLAGYTLVELLIVIVLAAIIMSLGIPSYRNYSMRANRVDATSALLRIAAAQERFFLDEDTYTEDPGDLGFNPPKTERGYYDLSIEPAAGGIVAGYVVTAQASPGQAQANDSDCTRLSLDQSGRRDSNPGDPDVCWR